jgi:6-phosphogluconolactonase
MSRALASVFFAVLGVYACNPGTGTVQQADTDATAGDAEFPIDMRFAPEDMQAADDVRPDRDVADDDAADTGSFPPPPARFFTAETDGTIAWGTHDYAATELELDGSIERGGRVTFLAFSGDGRRLFATNQNRVEAFDVSEGQAPEFIADGDAGIGGTHLEVDRTGEWVFVASYGDNAVSMLPIAGDGAPGDATVTLGGDGDPGFCQNAHQVRVHPGNEVVYVPCLGSDHVAVLSFDASAGTLEPRSPAETADGAGPRHMDFHPELPIAYVIGELDDTITIYDIDEETGGLTRRDIISTRPDPADPLGPASDIHVSPDGRFVVGINRNPRNEIVVFGADDQGDLTELDRRSTEGEHARTFAFAPGGRRILVGNSDSMDVALFDFSESGSLTHQTTLDEFDERLFFVGFPR